MEIKNMTYPSQLFYDFPNISRICVDTLRHAVRSNTVDIMQFGRDDHITHSSQDEEATIHAMKRTA